MEISGRTQLPQVRIQVAVGHPEPVLQLGEAAGTCIEQAGEVRAHDLMKNRVEDGKVLHLGFRRHEAPGRLIPAPSRLAGGKMNASQPAVDLSEFRRIGFIRQHPAAMFRQRQFLPVEFLLRNRGIEDTAEFAVRPATQKVPDVAQLLDMSVDPPVAQEQRRLERRIRGEYLSGPARPLGYHLENLPVGAPEAVGHGGKFLQMPPQGCLHERKRLEITLQEALDVSRVGGAECCPAGLGEPKLQRSDRRSLIEEGVHLCPAELTEAAKRLDAGKCADADDAELAARHLRAGKPVQELKQLKLVQEIVLEPERYVVITLRRREMLVS